MATQSYQRKQILKVSIRISFSEFKEHQLMFTRFIERPVLSTVISIIIVMLGILGLVELPIEQYPNIAPPTVMVAANYAGANAEVVLNSVIIPLEEQINGVEGMTYMTSSATNDGNGSINVYFAVGTDPDMAAVHVQDRFSASTVILPADVTIAGVIVRKQQSSNLLISAIYSDDPAYDQIFLQNYAEINIIPKIKRINGVGGANAFGSMMYSMRIWLKPDVMAVYNITSSDVTAALLDQNIEAAPGKFGEQGKQSFEYVIRYTGKLKTVKEFEDIIVRMGKDGHILRLKDVAKVELGAQSYNSDMFANGKPTTAVAISQNAGSNARDVIKESLKVLDEASKEFPEGVHYTNLVNANKFLDASIEKIIRTLLEAFILVFIVVFLFLQNFRATLIPAISVPVAIIGTFFFLYLFNFSINLLTLFAMLLAIGIVVDDAIVVVEVVHAKLDQGYTSARKASIDAMNEISVAIISITLVMASVFIPVTFLGGSSGVFYKQFGITIAIAILISAVNALTLSPALAALFLKPHNKKTNKPEKTHRFYELFNTGFNTAREKYTNTVSFLSGKKWIVIITVVIFGIGLFILMKTTSSSFVPEEDMGTVFVSISLPPASSMERTMIVTNRIDSIAKTIPGINNVMRIVGQKFLAELNKRPEIQLATTSFNPNFPQYLLTVNVPKVKEAGLDVSTIMNTMQANFGGIYVSNFNQFGKQYRIMVQAEPDSRANEKALNNIFVRTANNEMAPITEFITLTNTFGPERISRFNMFTSISVIGSPNKGFGSGEAITAIRDVAAKTLPPGYGFEFSGVTREEQNSGSQAIYVFILSILFVYFLLSALYESYLLPFAVLLSLPVVLAGTFVFAKFFGIDNNIYMQISLIMLIGLLAKNAILIVEFASTRREQGMTIAKAATEGAKARLRPILMTSLAFIFGIMPLMFATGAGAYGNRSIGTSAVGGMLFGTLFGVLVIPVLFIIFQTLQEKASVKKDSIDDNDAEIITAQN